jgi:hypothetical protein
MRLSKGQAVTPPANTTLWRPTTHEEYLEWRESPESKGIDCAGEPKLAPRTAYCRADGETEYRVTRARAVAEQGYYTVPKCCELEDDNGTRWFARRADLAAA